jgi:hypothetical protein
VSLFVDTRVWSPAFQRASSPFGERRELVPATESLWVLTGALISVTMARQPIEVRLPVGTPLRNTHDVTLAAAPPPFPPPLAGEEREGRPRVKEPTVFTHFLLRREWIGDTCSRRC